jgi:hypothetical protein
MEKACSRVLGKRILMFVGADADVGVAEYGGGNQDGGARQEADYEFKVPEDQMPAGVGVEDTKRCDHAPAPREVERVNVGEGDGGWAEIERSRGEGRHREVAAEAGIVLDQSIEGRGKERVNSRIPCAKEA